ncbi:hypothetical protein OG762_40880 [Streptomyces sp. NBC_01136]|uniref:hypothetical protein n=1 Tax=unclassified Streptomyces TaxID=2593676 RepID=UPI00324BA81A|nr:hypothetical protein OG762_40880 [Streptomyces sp. NBC_01136]
MTLWREGLTGRPDVTIQIHEADDHLFFPGTGPSTPAGYMAPQHVDAAVIADVAAWLDGNCRLRRESCERASHHPDAGCRPLG